MPITLTGGMTLVGGAQITPPPPPPSFFGFTTADFTADDDVVRPTDVSQTVMIPNSKRGGVRSFKISDTKFVTIGMYNTSNSVINAKYYCTLSTINSSGVITQVDAVELWDIQNTNTWGNDSDCGYCQIVQFDTDKYGIAEFYGDCFTGGSQNKKSFLRLFTLNTTTGAVTKQSNWTTLPKCDTSWTSQPQNADRNGGAVALDSDRLYTYRGIGAQDAVFSALLRYRTYHWIHTINWSNFTISSTPNTIFNEEDGNMIYDNSTKADFLLPGGDKVMLISYTGGGNNIGGLVVDVSGTNPSPGNRNNVRFEAYGGTMLNTNVQSDGVGISSTLGVVFSEDVAGNICALSWTVSGNNVSYTGTSLNFGSTASRNNQPIHLGDGRVLLCIDSDGATGQTWTVATIESDGTMSSTIESTTAQNTSINSYDGINVFKLDDDTVVSVHVAPANAGSDAYTLTK